MRKAYDPHVKYEKWKLKTIDIFAGKGDAALSEALKTFADQIVSNISGSVEMTRTER